MLSTLLQPTWCHVSAYLFLFGVQLKALGKRAGLRLQMLLLHLTHAFSIWDVLILSPFEETVGRTQHESQRDHRGIQKTFTTALNGHITRQPWALLRKCAIRAPARDRSHLLVFRLFVPFNDDFDMRRPSRTARLECPVENEIKRTQCIICHSADDTDFLLHKSMRG